MIMIHGRLEFECFYTNKKIESSVAKPSHICLCVLSNHYVTILFIHSTIELYSSELYYTHATPHKGIE